MQVMPMQPLLLHRHPLQLCRLCMHGLELVRSRHLRNRTLQLSWICSSYRENKYKKISDWTRWTQNAVESQAVCTSEINITYQTKGGAASHDHEEDH